jgi:hypothetical protein
MLIGTDLLVTVIAFYRLEANRRRRVVEPGRSAGVP